MTREERENAIKCLKLWIKREPQLQTYKTCLEALEQEPMRDATPEERESVDAYIKSVSKPTGIEFDEEQEQLDFVQPHKSIPVKLKVGSSGDAISRKSIKHKLQEHHDFFVNTYDGFNNLPSNDKARVDEILNCIAMVVNEPSVKPQEPAYCDRNICLKNEYNGIGCDECEVTKSQEPSGDAVSREAVLSMQYRIDDSATLSTRDVVNVDDIEDLPSVNPQPCEDAVSREAVDDILCLYSDGNGMIDARGAVRMVRELPSVNPQKSGKWIITSMSNMAYCSECDYLFKDIPAHLVKQFNNCPNCGTRMIER